MSFEKAKQQYLAIANESPRLTAATTNFRELHFNGLNAPGNDNDNRPDESSQGRRSSVDSTPTVFQFAPLGWNDVCDADELLWLLYYVFGGGTPTTANGATTWDFVVNQNLETPTATVQYDTGIGGQKRVRGWLPSKLELEFTPNDCKYSIEGAGIVEEPGTSITPTYTTRDKKLLGYHSAISYATTQAGLSSGTSIGEVKSIKFIFETGMDIQTHRYLGSKNPTNNTVNGWNVSVEFEVAVSSAQANTLQGFNDNNTENAIRLDVEATDYDNIGSSTLKPKLLIDGTPSSWKVQRVMDLDSIIMQKVTMKLNSADLATAQLINAISAI